MPQLTKQQVIDHEKETLRHWETKEANAERLLECMESDAEKNRYDAIYARKCVEIQKLKIQELENEE